MFELLLAGITVPHKRASRARNCPGFLGGSLAPRSAHREITSVALSSKRRLSRQRQEVRITTVKLRRKVAARRTCQLGGTQLEVGPGQCVRQLTTAVDFELSKYPSQVPLNGARTEEQSRADLRI